MTPYGRRVFYQDNTIVVLITTSDHTTGTACEFPASNDTATSMTSFVARLRSYDPVPVIDFIDNIRKSMKIPFPLFVPRKIITPKKISLAYLCRWLK